MRKMVVVGVIIWAVVSLAALSWAEPFLVCDPQTDAEGYIYTLNGGAEITVPYATAVMGGKTVAVIADLGPLPVGQFTYSVKAYNIWGQSSAVPFADSKQYPGLPSSMAIAR